MESQWPCSSSVPSDKRGYWQSGDVHDVSSSSAPHSVGRWPARRRRPRLPPHRPGHPPTRRESNGPMPLFLDVGEGSMTVHLVSERLQSAVIVIAEAASAPVPGPTSIPEIERRYSTCSGNARSRHSGVSGNGSTIEVPCSRHALPPGTRLRHGRRCTLWSSS